MRRSLWVLVVLVALGFPASALADTLDQSVFDVNQYGGFGSANTSALFGQTFTAGLTGNLTRIHIDGYTFPDFSFSVMIYSVSGGFPDSLLSGTTFSGVGATNFDFTTDIFFPTTIAVIAGQQYAIVIQPLRNLVLWNGSIPEIYAGGTAVFLNSGGQWATQSGQDFYFQTYVDTNATVPEPGTLLLLGTGLAGICLKRKRRAI